MINLNYTIRYKADGLTGFETLVVANTWAHILTRLENAVRVATGATKVEILDYAYAGLAA